MCTEKGRITDRQVKEFLATQPVPIGLAVKPVEIWLKRQLKLQKEKEENAKQKERKE